MNVANRRYASLKSRAAQLGASLPFTREEFVEWFSRHKDDVCPCGGAATTLDHVIPLARQGSHALSNYQMLCAPCNGRKWRWLDGEERMWPWQIPGAKKHTGPKKKRVRQAPTSKRVFKPGDVMWIGGLRYVYPPVPDIL